MPKKNMKFMKVMFGDNDFWMSVDSALKDLWNWANNSPIRIEMAVSVSDFLIEMDKQGKLVLVIEHFINVEYMIIKPPYGEADISCTQYLDLSISFRKTPDSKWRNCEVIQLNMDTGATKLL